MMDSVVRSTRCQFQNNCKINCILSFSFFHSFCFLCHQCYGHYYLSDHSHHHVIDVIFVVIIILPSFLCILFYSVAASEFDETEEIDFNALSFDSTIALSNHAFKEDHSNLTGFFVFGFENLDTGEKFCHGFPMNGMGNNWDYEMFYDYETESYDFYYYDQKRNPSYSEIYDEYFPQRDLGVFEKFIIHVIESNYQNGHQVSSLDILFEETYEKLKVEAQFEFGCTNLPATEEELEAFPLLGKEKKDSIAAASKVDESLLKEGKKNTTKIRRTNVANSKLGLTVVLNPDEKNYKGIIKNNYRGFRALVHGPLDFAEVSGKGFPIGKGEEVFVGIQPEYMESSEEVKNMPLNQRQCLTPDEDLTQHPNIKYEAFSKYNRKACLLECTANRIMKQCKCLPYYYPRFDLVWKTNTSCDFEGLKCLAEHADEAKAMFVDGPGFLKGSKCNCPSNCDTTTYLTEITKAKVVPTNKYMSRIREDENTIIRNLTLTVKRYG